MPRHRNLLNVGTAEPLPTGWSRRVPAQQPQVDNLIGREIRVRGGHAGIGSNHVPIRPGISISAGKRAVRR